MAAAVLASGGVGCKFKPRQGRCGLVVWILGTTPSVASNLATLQIKKELLCVHARTSRQHVHLGRHHTSSQKDNRVLMKSLKTRVIINYERRAKPRMRTLVVVIVKLV